VAHRKRDLARSIMINVIAFRTFSNIRRNSEGNILMTRGAMSMEERVKNKGA